MREEIDRTGERIGRLTITGRNYTKDPKRKMWDCVCDCGKTLTVRDDSLKNNHTRSCGCYQRERARETASDPSHHPIKHGESYERLFNIWYLMKYRCENPKAPAYHNYGERGITVCDEWSEYFAFKSWALNNGYSEELTLDRTDNNLGYSPDNCRWITRFDQAGNKRSNRMIAFNGVEKTLSQWARDVGMDMKALHNRLSLGWDIERALTQPLRKSSRKISH